MRIVLAILAIVFTGDFALAQQHSVAANDIYATFFETYPFVAVRDTNGLTLRTDNYNPAQKNLALIVAGRSLCENVNPTLFVPSSSSVIDQKNIYDGASYNINGMMLGAVNGAPNPGSGPGNVSARLAQLFVTNGIFDHVVVASICMGSTIATDWDTGVVSNRIPAILRRFASRGITPSTSSWTFAISWWHGEAEVVSAAAYTASLNTILANARSNGFTCSNCRFFVNEETYVAGVTNATIQGAQTAIWGTSQFFAGGNIDTLGAGNRLADNAHLNDAGAAAAALLVYNAMHASGAPF